MALAIGYGTGQTGSAATAVTPKVLNVLNWRYLSEEPGESVYVNTAGALDQPNSIRHGYSVVRDVFKNSPVDPIEGQRVDGISILCQVNEVWKVYDDASTSVTPLLLPASAHFVLKLPINALVTSTSAVGILNRLMGSFYRSVDTAQADAFAPLLKGVTSL